MREIILTIFSQYSFTQSGEKETASFLECADSQRKEFYLLDFVSADTLERNGVDGIKVPLELYETQRAERADVDKNTSLVMCIEVGELKSDSVRLKNLILKIEEDDYWFKRYVILYTAASLSEELKSQPVSHLMSIIKDSVRFSAFQEDMFEDDEYFFAVQLFLKLPFLEVPVNNFNDYSSVQSMFRSAVTESDNSFRTNITAFANENENFDWKAFEKQCLDVSVEDTFFIDFIEKFS